MGGGKLNDMVDILILGAGWTSSFLIPLCIEQGLSYGATTRDGRDGTIKFSFDPELSGGGDLEAYRTLPDARTLLVTFPITTPGGAKRLVENYLASRDGAAQDEVAQRIQVIQLGTTSIWDGHRKARGTQKTDPPPPPKKVESKWYDRNSPFVPNERAKEEEALLQLAGPHVGTAVLNLVGLWGGSRTPKNWVGKVAATKEALSNKGSLHLIHGKDVARAIVAVHKGFSKASGQRWIVSDGRVYDWWDLASAWKIGDGEASQARWVRELMREKGIKALPRNVELLGRAIDSREFWETFDLEPESLLV